MTRRRLGLAWIFALVCALGCAMPAAARAGEIIVARDAGLNAAERANIRADAGVELKGLLALPRTEVVSAPAGEEAAAVAALNADPGVRYAVAELELHTAAALEPDPNFVDQWALESSAHADIDILKAWPISEGEGVTVGVVDQEVDVTHADLDGNIADGGRDFTSPDGCTVATPKGQADHGTYVAGIVAAERENGVGIAGVAPEARLLPLRAVNNCGETNDIWLTNALTHAGQAGVPIVVAAFGTYPGQLAAETLARYNQLFADIFRTYDQTLFIVPSGNEGNDNGVLPVYPCSTVDPSTGERPPNLVCVGATNKTDLPVCTGNVSKRFVDLFAPGAEILSTVRGGSGGLQLSGGTSAAAAIVAGVAALVKAFDPESSAAQLKHRLLNSVGTTIPSLERVSVSGGRINAARAVEARGVGVNYGRSGEWNSCDIDHDGVVLNEEDCPAQFGPRALRGCPDSDGDGLRDIDDNCPTVANADQADDDGDGIGTVCDTTPRGADVDGDGRGALDDACPTVYGTLANGCRAVVIVRPTVTPTPTPAPPWPPAADVASVSVKVNKCPRRHGRCLKAAKVTVRLTRAATASLRFEQRVKRGRKHVWKRYTVKSMKAATSARSYTLKRLKAGSYRVIVSVAGNSKTKSFRV